MKGSDAAGWTFTQALVLLLLVMQTTSSCTLMSYSKGVLKENYNPLEAVMVTECMKFVASGLLSVFLFENEDKHHPFNLASNVSRVLLLLGKNLNLLVLVVIWTYTNTISFRAVALVGAPTYSVVMQSKIFFTAGFGVLFLSRRYSFTKWRALILLVIGCILVSSPILLPKVDIPAALPCDLTMTGDKGSLALLNSTRTVSNPSNSNPVRRLLRGHADPGVVSSYSLTTTDFSSQTLNRYLSANTVPRDGGSRDTNTNSQSVSSGDSKEVNPLDAVFGLVITLSVAVCSGFTSVYFEKILKTSHGAKSVTSSPTTIWDRNFQLAFYSIVLTLSISMYQYATATSDSHSGVDTKSTPVAFFAGWSWVTVLICFINSVGGFLVAATLKYTDSISKCFASAVSIILTSLIGYFFLGNQINLFSGLGMLTTVLSVMNYSLVEIEQ